MKKTNFVLVALSFVLFQLLGNLGAAKGAKLKPQIQVAFEIFCEAEKRALEDRKRRAAEVPKGAPASNLKNDNGTPREILKFISDLAVSSYSFPDKEAETKFYQGVEAKRARLREMFWTVAKEFGHSEKTLRPEMERAENDASLGALRSPCGLSVSEKLMIFSELF